jgi:hypothetical protein
MREKKLGSRDCIDGRKKAEGDNHNSETKPDNLAFLDWALLRMMPVQEPESQTIPQTEEDQDREREWTPVPDKIDTIKRHYEFFSLEAWFDLALLRSIVVPTIGCKPAVIRNCDGDTGQDS